MLILIHHGYRFLLLHTCVNAEGVESRLVTPPGVLIWDWSISRGVLHAVTLSPDCCVSGSRVCVVIYSGGFVGLKKLWSSHSIYLNKHNTLVMLLFLCVKLYIHNMSQLLFL